MHDEFIEMENWYFKETRAEKIRELYPDVDQDSWDFILEKYCGLHIMHLVANLEELQLYFEDMFTESVADTKITRKLYQGRILDVRDGNLVLLTQEPNGAL